MGRAVVPILDAFGVSHVVVTHAGHAAAIVREAAERAFAARKPIACLLPRAVTAGADAGGGA
jgi:hypothetical protein